MSHMRSIATQFYTTTSQKCPYLENRLERKLFTSLQNDNAHDVANALSKQGFRRSQHVMYRHACTDCSACMSVRIPVAQVNFTTSQRRILRKNADLVRNTTSPWATEEQFYLFQEYIQARHSSGGMSDMDVFEFASMVEETPLRTRMIEYHLDQPEAGIEQSDLVATCLTDIHDDGLSMVYSFFEQAQAKRSLGIYLILDHINLAKSLDLPYVYLGYWVKGSPAMDYKKNFRPLEIYTGQAWKEFCDENDYNAQPYIPLEKSLAEQVNDLSAARDDE